MNNYQITKPHRFMYLLFALVLLFACITAVPSAMAAEEGVNVTAQEGTQTMYYLKLPIKNKKFYMVDYNNTVTNNLVRPWAADNRPWYAFWDSMVPWAYPKLATAMDNQVHTVIFTYNNITVNNLPVLTSWNIQTRVTTGGDNIFTTRYFEFTVLDDIEINIRSEYFNLFQNADFSQVSATFIAYAKGYKLYSSLSSTANYHDFSAATLEQREVPQDYDPIAEEGQAPDNGGIITTPDNGNESANDANNWVEEYLKRVFKGGAGAFDWIIFGLSVAVVIIIAGVIYRIYRR